MNADTPRVRVEILLGIRELFKEREREIEIERVPNIRELLNILCDSYERRQRVFDQSGEIRWDVSILKNGRNIRFLNGLDTVLTKGDTIVIVPMMKGG